MTYIPTSKLIQLVKQESAIYDPGNCHHRDKEYLTEAWIKIARELNSTAFVCKTKWNNLRSNYARELRRESLKLLDENQDRVYPPNKWPFYPMLSFLNPFLRSRALILEKRASFVDKHPNDLCSIKTETHCNSVEDELDFELPEANEVDDYNKSTVCNKPISPTETASCSWDSTKDRDYSADFAVVNSTPVIDQAVTYPEDSDKFFLLSLLPMIKQLSPADNLGFRLEVQQILQKKLFPS